jgi:hypothetical protein
VIDCNHLEAFRWRRIGCTLTRRINDSGECHCFAKLAAIDFAAFEFLYEIGNKSFHAPPLPVLCSIRLHPVPIYSKMIISVRVNVTISLTHRKSRDFSWTASVARNANIRFGSKADMPAAARYVRLVPRADVKSPVGGAVLRTDKTPLASG